MRSRVSTDYCAARITIPVYNRTSAVVMSYIVNLKSSGAVQPDGYKTFIIVQRFKKARTFKNLAQLAHDEHLYSPTAPSRPRPRVYGHPRPPQSSSVRGVVPIIVFLLLLRLLLLEPPGGAGLSCTRAPANTKGYSSTYGIR